MKECMTFAQFLKGLKYLDQADSTMYSQHGGADVTCSAAT